MPHFTNDQLDEIATVFGLRRKTDVLPIKDGVVSKDQKVWWRGEDGPEFVIAEKEWDNIRHYPEIYSHVRPAGKFVYED